MKPPRGWARRSDPNQPEIVKGLRQLGLPVRVLSQCPFGALDIITGYQGVLYWVEIKTEPDGKLTKQEQKTFDWFQGYPVIKTHSLEDLLKQMGAT